MIKQITAYMKKHPGFNAATHIVGGMGIGIIMARPLIGPHPIRWGIGMLLISLAGHVYALCEKK